MIYWDLRSAAEWPSPLAAAGAAMLSPGERVTWARLRSPKRRRDWLLGRLALKELCRAWLAAQGRAVAPTDLTVASAPSGAPYLELRGEGRLALAVSLSHRDDVALCGLCDSAIAGFGVDLELCEPRPASFAEDYFTAAELEQVGDAGDRWRCVTEIWSLKESVLKALGVGLTVDTRSIEVQPRAPRSAHGDRPAPAPLDESSSGTHPAWTPAAVVHPDLGRWRAFARDEGRFVLTAAALGGEVSLPSDALRHGGAQAQPREEAARQPL